MGDLAHLPCVLALALVPVLARAQALALVHAQTFAQFQWCLVFRGSDNPRPEMAAAWAPPPKNSKTIENSIFRALAPPGTSPERSGTAQDHLKACSSHPSAAQSGLQDAMLCVQGAVLCAQGAILCALGTQNSLKFH